MNHEHEENAMARIGVQSEDLHSQSARVGTGSETVRQTLDQLTGEIANLAASWQGGASEAFQSRWAEWQAGATQVQAAMESMGQFLQQAAVAYETTEDELRTAAGR